MRSAFLEFFEYTREIFAGSGLGNYLYIGWTFRTERGFTKKEKINKSKILKLSGVGVNLKKFNYLEKKKKKIGNFPSESS